MTDSTIPELIKAGISFADALTLRRAARQLHGWFELECGTDAGLIQRSENGEPRLHRMTPRGYADRGELVRDLEAVARQCIDEIMARYPSLVYYVQHDPRGAALYILRASDMPAGEDIAACYHRGIAVA